MKMNHKNRRNTTNSKTMTNQLGSVSDEHLHELRAGELEEGGLGLSGDGASHHRLASAWKYTIFRLDQNIDF